MGAVPQSVEVARMVPVETEPETPPDGEPDSESESPVEAGPENARRSMVRFVPRVLRDGGWPMRVLAGVVAVAVIAVVVGLVRGLGGADAPEQPAPPGAFGDTAGQPAKGGWTEVFHRTGATLADQQAFDLDTGTPGDSTTPGIDVRLFNRADRLWAGTAAQVSLLDGSGEVASGRCTALAPQRWHDMVNGLRALAKGRDVCVATGEHRCALLTIDRIPNDATPTLTFHYTLWERR
jgi:hypothetical protein